MGVAVLGKDTLNRNNEKDTKSKKKQKTQQVKEEKLTFVVGVQLCTPTTKVNFSSLQATSLSFGGVRGHVPFLQMSIIKKSIKTTNKL